jgi:hypothetical protein
LESYQDIYNEVEEIRKDLSKYIKYLRQTNKELAKAERDYRMKLSTRILELHTEGYKGTINGKEYDTDSVAWTTCWDLARGLPGVAKLRFRRDIAKGEKESVMQKVYAVKREMEFLVDELKAIRKGE